MSTYTKVVHYVKPTNMFVKCKVCNEFKNVEEYTTSKKEVVGRFNIVYHTHNCKECRKIELTLRQAERRQRRKEQNATCVI